MVGKATFSTKNICFGKKNNKMMSAQSITSEHIKNGSTYHNIHLCSYKKCLTYIREQIFSSFSYGIVWNAIFHTRLATLHYIHKKPACVIHVSNIYKIKMLWLPITFIEPGKRTKMRSTPTVSSEKCKASQCTLFWTAVDIKVKKYIKNSDSFSSLFHPKLFFMFRHVMYTVTLLGR